MAWGYWSLLSIVSWTSFLLWHHSRAHNGSSLKFDTLDRQTISVLDRIYSSYDLNNLALTANYSGDIVLAAVFPIHERDQNYSCGVLQEESLLELEALAFTLKRINDDPDILPGIRLGVVSIDSCDSPHHALEQSLVFIKSFVTSSSNAELSLYHSTNAIKDSSEDWNVQKPIVNGEYGQFDRVLGLIGGQSSEVSLQLANVLRLFKVPQVSYMSTSPTLSSSLYDFFFRTVPSDTNQVEAIVDILVNFRWTYVSVVYSDTEYGNNGYDLLSAAANQRNICISNPQEINAERFTDIDYEQIITTLMNKINARVVVVFADRIIARRLMLAAKNFESERFVWIASDAWSCRDSVVHGLENVVEGTISVTPLSYRLKNFIQHFRTLRPELNTNNPWFDEFWQRHFRCILPNYYERHSKQFKDVLDVRICNDSLEIDDRTIMTDPSMHFVRDALYTFAKTFDNIHKQLCNGVPGICSAMRHHVLNSTLLAESILNVTFLDEGNNTFRFQPNGDAPARYQVVNFQRNSNGDFEWTPVGTYLVQDHSGKPKLIMNRELMKFKGDSREFPESFCSKPCTVGQIKLKLEADTCCWLCSNCSQYQIRSTEYLCTDCPDTHLPDENKTFCLPLSPMKHSITNWWTVCAICFALTGMAGTILTLIVFWRFSETPVIKAAGRELSILQLVGIFLSFAMSFVIVAPPSTLTCGLTRFFLGFCYTVCYSAIVTKTNRISRIFRHRSCKKPRFTSPLSQLVITALLITIEVVVNIFWMFYDPPTTELVYPTRESAMLICSGSYKTSYLFGLLYPLILIGFCTVYAFKTRKCPEGFNEARYITFTNYTTCVVWFAFLPMFVMLQRTTPFRYLILCYLMSVSGTVQLFCLFVPKMYIALLKPEKNTRESVMCGSHYSRALYANQFVYRHNIETSDNSNSHFSSQNNNDTLQNSANNNNHFSNMSGHISVRSTTTPTTTTTLPDQCSTSSEHEHFVVAGAENQAQTNNKHKISRQNDTELNINADHTNSNNNISNSQKEISISVSSTGNTASSPPPTPSPLFPISPIASPEKAFIFYPMDAFCHLARITSLQRAHSTSSPMLSTNLDNSNVIKHQTKAQTTQKNTTKATKHQTSAVLGHHQRWPLIKLAVESPNTSNNLVTTQNTNTTTVTTAFRNNNNNDKPVIVQNGF